MDSAALSVVEKACRSGGFRVTGHSLARRAAPTTGGLEEEDAVHVLSEQITNTERPFRFGIDLCRALLKDG